MARIRATRQPASCCCAGKEVRQILPCQTDSAAGKCRCRIEVQRDTPDFDYTSTPVNLPGYTLLNLSAGYKLDKKLDLSLRVDNLFNRDYSEAYGYNTLGRTLFVGLNYQQ